MVNNSNGGLSSQTDLTLTRAIAKAHGWTQELIEGKTKTIVTIARRENTSETYITRILPLAFLSPDIVDFIIAGKQPSDLTVEKLTRRITIPMDWNTQRQILGFNQFQQNSIN